ncbi:hypothetical protein GGI42DRAFT_276747 [Trichoderma sp. SZMC 28013]
MIRSWTYKAGLLVLGRPAIYKYSIQHPSSMTYSHVLRVQLLAASAAQTKHDSQRTRHGSQLLPGLYCTTRSAPRKCKRLRVAALLVAPYEEKPFVLIQTYADAVFELAPTPY